MISVVALLAAFAFVMPSAINGAYPNKLQDCSRCHGPTSGAYYDSIMSISVSKTLLQPGEVYSVGIDIVIQTGLSKRETGYAIEDLTTSTWPVWLDATAEQSHYDQSMTAPSTPGIYGYRVWGESGPATSDGKTDYDDYTITVEQAPPANGPPTVASLANVSGAVKMVMNFSAAATDPDGDSLTYTWNFGDSTVLVVGTAVAHTYLAAGLYTFMVSVNDAHGHNVTVSANANVTGPFTLNLVTGWNFVSVPLVGYGYKAGTLGLGAGATVSKWNPLTASYTSWVSTLPSLNNFTINPSEGYWINVPAAKTITLYGAAANTVQSRTIDFKVGSGWAIVGFASLNATRHARDINTLMWSVPGGVTTVSKWTGTGYSNWVSTIPTLNNFLLVPGQAYWIQASQNGTLSYTP